MRLSTAWLYTDCSTYEGAVNCMARDSDTPYWRSSYIPQGQIVRKYKLSGCMVSYMCNTQYSPLQNQIRSLTDRNVTAKSPALSPSSIHSPPSNHFVFIPTRKNPPPFKNVVISVSLVFKNSISLKLPNLKLYQSEIVCVKSWL